MKATAFCPGHITGFFQICEHREPLRSGSRGAGICTSLGATTTVVSKRGKGAISVEIDGEKSDAPVTKQALARLILGRQLDLKVQTTLDLPVGQGFGMSAAGALSSALAAAEMLEMPFQKALEAAHEAEILHHTGLGDVAALSRGGVTIRTVEGLPPLGRVDRIPANAELALAVVGPPMPTASVLSNHDIRDRVNLVGRECVEEIMKSPSFANLFRLSKEFALRTGLATDRVDSALRELEGIGLAGMVMLGNSIFAAGDLAEQEAILAEYGQTYRAEIDWKGPRIIDSSR